MNNNLVWQKLYYSLGELKYEGFTSFSSNNKEYVPSGNGVKYFKNGKKYMEGSFGNDWFIETGIEYYENGNIKFTGEYNKGPRNYYGHRYFVFGRLFYESGVLWYEGSFRFKRSSIGYPLFEGDKSFKDDTEFNIDGTIKQKYINGIAQII